MQHGSGPYDETLPLEAVERTERACRAFEAAWKEGNKPSIEAALEEVAGPERAALLRELILLDIDYRLRTGESPSIGTYCARFPADAAAVEAIGLQQRRSQAEGIAPTERLSKHRRLETSGLVPTSIGPYQLLETLGQGGMGVVYLAEQRNPIHRRVALKVIKLGMDTREIIGRFEAEKQALALMNHPSIASVLDAGSTPDGSPYFVMEHVPGEPITHYCDRHRLSIRERLALFIQVCEAIQHAHEKAMIHRDIKPSNVLVMMLDERAHPKVIDFGVAKVLNQRLTEKTFFTELGQIIGTPEYMSPEQADMTALDLDTRTDIYSLGVLLYELLVSELPFNARELRAAGYREFHRIISQEEPPKPSARLSTRGEASRKVAQARRTEPSRLLREIRGDLDCVVLKALEKDRTRRYASAKELAADVGRFLRLEPVLAGPPGVWRMAARGIRRHPDLSDAVVALAVLGSPVLTRIGMAGFYLMIVVLTLAAVYVVKFGSKWASRIVLVILVIWVLYITFVTYKLFG